MFYRASSLSSLTVLARFLFFFCFCTIFLSHAGASACTGPGGSMADHRRTQNVCVGARPRLLTSTSKFPLTHNCTGVSGSSWSVTTGHWCNNRQRHGATDGAGAAAADADAASARAGIALYLVRMSANWADTASATSSPTVAPGPTSHTCSSVAVRTATATHGAGSEPGGAGANCKPKTRLP